MKKTDYIGIINDLNSKNVWVPMRIELQLSSDQFIAFLKGYQPNWDMRFEILFNRNDLYFYIYRSGFVVGKYRFDKTGPDRYTCVEMFDNPNHSDSLVIFECIREACRVNHVDIDLDALAQMVTKSRNLIK